MTTKEREKEQEKIGQQSKRMETAKDDKNFRATTNHLKKPHDLEKQGGVTRNKAICGTSSPTDKSSDVRPWDLTLETGAESAARHIESDPTPSERKEPQPREEQEELHTEPLEFLAVSLFWNLEILVILLVRAIYRQIVEIENQDRQERRAR